MRGFATIYVGMSNLREARVALEIVDHLYASVLEDGRLVHALDALRKLFGAAAVGVRVETRAAEKGARAGCEIVHSVGLPDGFKQAYSRDYWHRDPWAAGAWLAPPGVFAHGSQLCQRSTYEASALHNELSRAHGLGEMFAGAIAQSPGRVVGFGLFRERRDGGFSTSLDGLAGSIVPHVARAFELKERLREQAQPVVYGDQAAQLERELQALHALTPAEARVARKIAEGLSPKDVARAHGTSWDTVRAQLRQVFAKMEVHTQASLTRKVVLLEHRLQRRAALSR